MVDRVTTVSCALVATLLLASCTTSAGRRSDALPRGVSQAGTATVSRDAEPEGPRVGEASIGVPEPTGGPHASPRPSRTRTTPPPPVDTGSPPPTSTTGTTDPADEVLPPTSSSSTMPGLLPPIDTTAPLVTRPLPPTAATQGRLVKGYPVAALPLLNGSRALTSSVSRSPGRLQVTLTATTKAGPARVATFYSALLGRLGFGEKAAPAVGGSTAQAFRRGHNTVLLTITPGSTTSYSLFASLIAGG